MDWSLLVVILLVQLAAILAGLIILRRQLVEDLRVQLLRSQEKFAKGPQISFGIEKDLESIARGVSTLLRRVGSPEQNSSDTAQPPQADPPPLDHGLDGELLPTFRPQAMGSTEPSSAHSSSTTSEPEFGETIRRYCERRLRLDELTAQATNAGVRWGSFVDSGGHFAFRERTTENRLVGFNVDDDDHYWLVLSEGTHWDVEFAKFFVLSGQRSPLMGDIVFATEPAMVRFESGSPTDVVFGTMVKSG